MFWVIQQIIGIGSKHLNHLTEPKKNEMHQVFEKQCGYQAYRECQVHDKQAKVLVNKPNSSLYFIILIFLSRTDLVAPVLVIKTALREG